MSDESVRSRLLRLTREQVDLLVVGLLVAGATTVYAIYALRVGSFQGDEEQYMQLARYIAHDFPQVLWQASAYPRGTQRLDPMILAPAFAVMRGPGAFQLDHVIQCLLFSSTALPVFLLARRSGIGRAPTLFAAALSIVVPWAVVSTSFLAESAAYPAYAWVLYATWSLIRRPTPARELLTLVALAVAALSRSAMLALAPLPPLAILWHEWSWGLGERPRSARLRELPRRLLTRYRILTPALALAVVVYLANELGLLPGRGLASLAGEYGLPHLEALSALLARFREYLSRMTAGTGYLAVAIALPWTVGTLVRPRDGTRHALAVVGTLGVAAILLSLLKGGPDERYILYGAVPISLLAAAALADLGSRRWRPRPIAALGALAGAIAVMLLIDSVTWPGLVNAYDFFTYPSAIFYSRVVVNHVTTIHLPLLQPGATRLVELAVLLVMAAWVVTWRWTEARRAAAVALGVGLLVLCGGQTVYALERYTEGAGEASRSTASERSWVDEHVPSGVRVGRLLISEGEGPNYAPIWHAASFWNTSVTMDVYSSADDPLPAFLGYLPLEFAIDPRSGRLSLSEAGVKPEPTSLLRYLLVPSQGTNGLAVDGQIVGQDPYLQLTLIEPTQPPRLDWRVTGTNIEAFATSDKPVVATIYPAGLEHPGPLCASFVLIAAPHFAGRWPFRVAVGRHVLRRGTIPSQRTVTITVPLPRFTGAPIELDTTVHGQAPYASTMLSARFANLAIARCRSGA